MRKVTFTGWAERDLEQCYEWIARDSPRQAARFIQAVERKVLSLDGRAFDYGYHPAVGPPYRRLLHGSYEIFYEVRGDLVVIIAVLHGARDLPALLSDRSRRR